MRLTAADLAAMNLVDEVIAEPLGGAHHDVRAAARSLKEALVRQIDTLTKLSEQELLEARYSKFREAGQWKGE